MKWILAAMVLGIGLMALSCQKQSEVVLYTSVDEPYIRQLIKRFEIANGVKVVLVTDSEGAKTTGLAERVLAERERPRCDVYWGNEPFHTVRLAEAGVLQAYNSPNAAEIPGQFKDEAGLWTGVGFRARMLAVTSRRDLAPIVGEVLGIERLGHPSLRNRIAIASPATGTTSGHLAALYVFWGEERYRAWLMALRQNNVKLVGGNSVVATMVGEGTLLAGLTDNDDISAAVTAGGLLRGFLPDQTISEEDAKRLSESQPKDAPAQSADLPGQGTLLVPTTVALVKGGPNPDHARKLIDFLVDRRVEDQLFENKFLYGTLRDIGNTRVRALPVDYVEVSRQMRRATEIALTILQDRPAPPAP